MALTREECVALDARDPLAGLRNEFALVDADRRGLIYLDGNSLGALPTRTLARLQEVAVREWGADLIASWNTAGWITLAERVGDKIARVIGARPGEVIAADSTSINLYKALHAALAINHQRVGARPRIVSERANFPGDLYIAESVARERGVHLALVDSEAVHDALDDQVAVLMLTHVNYRTGRMHDLRALTHAAHAVGALTVWDVAHSAGAVQVSLNEASADFAIGCGYKYLNGGPGAPAFIWVRAALLAELDRVGWSQPLSGWLGHAAPFEFATEYRSAAGVRRFTTGTPPILSLAALECGVDLLLEAEVHGGIAAIREKSERLTEAFIELVESECRGHGLALVTPRDPAQRGSQVCFSHPTHGYALVQALIASGVVGDFRAPDILRFGFAPLYTRFVDVFDAVARLREVLTSGAWRSATLQRRATVT